jgi:hypothetical protein
VNAVHPDRVDPVEVDRVRVRATVDEAHAQPVALRRADHGARDGAVVRPRGEEHARCDLELAVDRRQRVVTDPARPVRQRGRRVEQGVEVVRPADGGRRLADHRRVAERVVRVVVPLVRRQVLGLLPVGERELRERAGRDERRGPRDEAAARQPGHASKPTEI